MSKSKQFEWELIDMLEDICMKYNKNGEQEITFVFQGDVEDGYYYIEEFKELGIDSNEEAEEYYGLLDKLTDVAKSYLKANDLDVFALDLENLLYN